MKNVSAAIIRKEGTALLAKRSESEKLAGYWEFPGGKKDENKTILECIERELHEELNVNAVAIDIFAESVYEYDNGTIKLIGVNVLLENEDFTLSVHDEIRWVPIKDLLTYKLAPADIPIAEKLQGKL